ncbi:hypothetical protein DFQ30_011344 [Apophysomyces sp. BC1015]|nr:hypothetical protein DFQ30_011344 [Apophysomyces sp. BC1015]KAG0176525.1 hypothetical protein DFQ29_005996 [Apophysomyces sp. BC1021]
METIDIELPQLKIHEQLRANTSFMKVMAALFHYGNASMNAGQLVAAVRALNLLVLRGETPRSTIQGIISTARKAARELHELDPFCIQRESVGRHAKYSISKSVLNGAMLPPQQELPEEPIVIKPMQQHTSPSGGVRQLGKRQRKAPMFYCPVTIVPANRRRSKGTSPKSKKSQQQQTISTPEDDVLDEFDGFTSTELSEEEEEDEEEEKLDEHGTHEPSPPVEDTINSYSLVYSTPQPDMGYIDSINPTEYPIAAHFGVAQQKGYSYPRFRSHEKIKIPKMHCEDKFSVADIVRQNKVVGRIYILADGHGGSGCSEFFVRNTPPAVRKLCQNYDPAMLSAKDIQQRYEHDIKKMVEELDEEYLNIKREQMRAQQDEDTQMEESSKANSTSMSHEAGSEASSMNSPETQRVDNDGCTLIINIFYGEWLINVNVGDSRSVLISAPEPSESTEEDDETATTCSYQSGVDSDYRMDVVFASQDHKPYLEHLAREILENGGEFVDSVQNRVIKVELDRLREDGGRHNKRLALRNARIRPKGSQDDQLNSQVYVEPCTPYSTMRASAGQYKTRTRGRVPSLNVARSCGDLDFKMVPNRKIISCQPDVSFLRISDSVNDVNKGKTTIASSAHKSRRRHFLFMSTDGTFDYMYEETAERQNRAIARIIGPMIEDGEKIGEYLLQEEDEGEQHKSSGANDDVAMDLDISNTSVQEEGGNNIPGKLPEAIDQGSEENLATEMAHISLLASELSPEEVKNRRIKERTLVMAARYFANRESAQGFFAPTLQDYDDCTIILIEI